MEADPTFVKEIDAKAAAGDEACKSASVCLQAMRSVICGSLASPSAAAYFAAAVAALAKQGEQKGGSSSTASALLLVLRKAIPAVSASAVCARLNDLAVAVAGVIRNADDEGLVRQALGCLMACTDAVYSAGGRPNRRVLKPVFAFLGDSRAPVRHQAELAATLTIKKAAATGDEQTLEFATQHLVQMIGAGRPAKNDPDEVPARHALTLVRAVGVVLPLASLTALCEALLRLPGTLGQHPVCIEAFEWLAQLFGKAPGEAAQAAHAELSAKLLPGLLGVPVTMLNVNYVVAYAKALASVVAVLCAEQALPHLPREVAGQKLAAAKKILGLFAERDPTVLRGTREASALAFRAAGAGGDLAMLDELPGLCKHLLGYESKGAWQHVLPVVTSVFNGLEAVRSSRVGPAEVAAWTDARFAKARGLLEQLVLARDKAHGGELGVFGEQLADCLGAAVACLGPERVLSVAELRIMETPFSEHRYEQLSRSWLLLVLRSSCRRAPLAVFASRFLPIATALKGKATEAERASQGIAAKKYQTLLEHVWALLPGFCDEPLDLNAALLAEGGKLAKQLVSVLQNEPVLRDYVWAAFTKACDCTREPPSPLSQALQESNRSCLQTLSGRVLPEMFNTYLKLHAELEGQDASRAGHSRRVALAAVQSYVRVADGALVGGLFKKLVARLLKATSGEPSSEQGQAQPLAELSSTIVPHLASEFLELALKVFAPMLSGAAAATEEGKAVANVLQKTAYRAVVGVIEHPAAAASSGGEGESSRILSLWNTLKDSRQLCSPTALKARLAALEAMLKLTEKHLSPRFREPSVRQEYLQVLTAVMPEILFHLRDQSTAVRDAARECLHVAATTAIHQELQAEIVTLISAGLAGLTRHSKASAVDALSRLMYEHGSKMSEQLQDRLIGVVLILLGDSDAQVWRAVLKFSKVVVYVVPKTRLTKLTPQLLAMFDSKHVSTAKMLIRHIVERLVKVLPAEELAAAFPSAHAPLLHYVQRQVSRQQRPQSTREKKDDKEDDGESKEDVEMGDEENGAPKKSWEDFQGGDVEDGDSKGEGQPAGKKRGRASEPPTSAVMAHDAVQALLDAWEEESDGSDDEGAAGGGRKSRGKRKRDREEATTTWIHENADVPLDFMSADAAHSVLTTRAAPAKRRRGAEVGPAGASSRVEALRRSGLRFAEDGRLVVTEEEEKATKEEDEKKAGFSVGADTKKAPVKALSKLAAMRKQRAEAKAKAKAERRGAHTIKGLDIFKPGKKAAAGDATRKGVNLEPYAYVKLNPKVAKEKFRDKATASFAKVIQGAKKGVLKGTKAKQRDAKLKKAKEARDKRRKNANKQRKPGSR